MNATEYVSRVRSRQTIDAEEAARQELAAEPVCLVEIVDNDATPAICARSDWSSCC